MNTESKGKKEGLPPQEMLPNPELVEKIVDGFHTHVDGGKDYLRKKLTDPVEQYRHFFSLDEWPDATIDDQIRYAVRYLEEIGDQHAFEWIVFHPQVQREDIQRAKEGIKSQLTSHTKVSITASSIMNEEGVHLFDHLSNLANKRGVNESGNLIIIEGIEKLPSEELGKFMYDLYTWPDNPRHRLHSKIIMYLPAEVDYIIQTTDIPAMAHKGGIRNTLDRANYLMIYEKQ